MVKDFLFMPKTTLSHLIFFVMVKIVMVKYVVLVNNNPVMVSHRLVVVNCYHVIINYSLVMVLLWFSYFVMVSHYTALFNIILLWLIVTLSRVNSTFVFPRA